MPAPALFLQPLAPAMLSFSQPKPRFLKISPFDLSGLSCTYILYMAIAPVMPPCVPIPFYLRWLAYGRFFYFLKHFFIPADLKNRELLYPCPVRTLGFRAQTIFSLSLVWGSRPRRAVQTLLSERSPYLEADFPAIGDRRKLRLSSLAPKAGKNSLSQFGKILLPRNSLSTSFARQPNTDWHLLHRRQSNWYFYLCDRVSYNIPLQVSPTAEAYKGL